VPLETLELRKNEICGVRASGREPFSTYVLKIVCELITRPGGGLRRLNLQENNLLGNEIYSSEWVTLLVDALKNPNCRLEELHLGLVNQQHGMHERDASVLGEAVRACTTLKALSITGALLPMAELLDSSVRLDLSGRGLGRVEMGIAAQLLHNNSSCARCDITVRRCACSTCTATACCLPWAMRSPTPSCGSNPRRRRTTSTSGATRR